jgi:flagellar hook assembly protein FlgD
MVHLARPNPLNQRTTLAFDVPAPGQIPVSLTIYDVEGRAVSRLLAGRLPAGQHAVEWDGRGGAGEPLAAGTYFYRVVIGDFVASRKLTLVR